MKKKALAIVLALTLIITVISTGCGSSGSSSGSAASSSGGEKAKVAFIGASPVDENGINSYLLLKMGEHASEASDGRLTLDFHGSGSLGSIRECVEGNIAGNIDTVGVTGSLFVDFVPQIALFDMPCMYKTIDDARDFMNDKEFIAQMAEYFAAANLKLFGMTDSGFRITSSNRPLQSVADFKGLKIRCMENQNHMTFWSELGANPTPMDSSEMFVALQQGTIDAQENPIASIFDNRIQEVQDYISLTNHIIFTLMAELNLNRWNSLSEEDQAIVTDAFLKAIDETREHSDAQEDVLFERAEKEYGIEIFKLSDEVLTEMRNKGEKAYAMVKDQIGEETYNFVIEKCSKSW